MEQHNILILGASPWNLHRVSHDVEIRNIQKAIKKSSGADAFSIETNSAAQYQDLGEAVLAQQPHILHFCGHGGGDVGLVFVDEDNNAQLADNTAMEKLIRMLGNHVRCVFLNACYSEVQAKLLIPHVDYVIGVQGTVGDADAQAFSTAFYEKLGAGYPLTYAFELAYNDHYHAEHCRPVLLSRSEHRLYHSDLDTLNEISQRLQTVTPGIALLGQAGRISAALPPALRARMQGTFGPERVLTLSPVSDDKQQGAFFAHLAEQAQSDQVDFSGLATVLQHRVEDGSLRCLLLGHLQRGSAEESRQLAELLRNLCEGGRLKVVIYGERRLRDLMVLNGALSPLNMLDSLYLAELGVEDVLKLEPELKREEAEDLLALSGGHPRLLREALFCYRQQPNLNKVAEQLQTAVDDIVDQCLCDFRGQEDSMVLLADCLREERAGYRADLIGDEVLAALYWHNLLRQQGHQLYWRCSLLRETVEAVAASLARRAGV